MAESREVKRRWWRARGPLFFSWRYIISGMFIAVVLISMAAVLLPEGVWAVLFFSITSPNGSGG